MANPFDQIKREDFNFDLTETTILETLILKKAREPKGKKYYYEKINSLGIDEKNLAHVSEKDFCWVFEIFDSIKRSGEEKGKIEGTIHRYLIVAKK